jgi:hypothetical protein
MFVTAYDERGFTETVVEQEGGMEYGYKFQQPHQVSGVVPVQCAVLEGEVAQCTVRWRGGRRVQCKLTLWFI